jgi:hypothetical protein
VLKHETGKIGCGVEVKLVAVEEQAQGEKGGGRELAGSELKKSHKIMNYY